ncbi:nuclear transport factor 2 family protein [Streptomyces sp. NPDC056669]|uniref:nuclear transport factor 2 family protein n=1 Tax=Streptomyces sp. NPDC056669 TaxID=3345903 RepID=UPI00369C1967
MYSLDEINWRTLDMNREIDKKAIRCLRLLESFDFSAVRTMCTQDATVWHNDGTGEQTLDEKLKQLESLVPKVTSMRYDITRQFWNGDEVLQQQVLHLLTPDGSRSEIHAAMYFRFRGDLIDRIEEYAYEAGGA